MHQSGLKLQRRRSQIKGGSELGRGRERGRESEGEGEGEREGEGDRELGRGGERRWRGGRKEKGV